MQKLAQRVARGDWEKYRRYKDIEPYLHIKQELSTAEGLIFREERIVLPEKLQKKVVKIGHSLGCLRDKYCFSYMNSMIDNASSTNARNVKL